MSLSAPNATLREFFTLARAEAAIRAVSPGQMEVVRALRQAGDLRLTTARHLPHTIPACVLLRSAVAFYLRAGRAARGAQDTQRTGERSLDGIESDVPALAADVPDLAPDPARPGATPDDARRVREALAARDELYFDRLSPADAERARCALEHAAATLRRSVETRTVEHLRAARWGRVIAVALVVAYAAVSGVYALVAPANVALHKPFTQTSVGATPAAGQTIDDGDTGTSYGVHTRVEESPSVVIDLLSTYRIYHVDVHNRVDGWFDDCLPLVVELSVDGKTYHEIGRRETHFDGSPPWVVPAHHEPARYVRVRVARKSYLALSEVEVFGKKK